MAEEALAAVTVAAAVAAVWDAWRKGWVCAEMTVVVEGAYGGSRWDGVL